MKNNTNINNHKSLIIKKFDAIYNLFTKGDSISQYLKESKTRHLNDFTPKIWNMDTQILTILNSFFDKVSKIGFNENDNYNLSIISENEKYKLLFNTQNVTPSSSKNKIEVAKNTMSQYVRVLSFFNVIIIKDYNELSKFISDNNDTYDSYDIFLSNEFRLICLTGSVTRWMTLGTIYDFIIKGIKNKNKDIMNMAFSLFVSTCYYLDKNHIIFNNEDDNKWTCIKPLKNKKIKDIGHVNNMNKFKILKKILNETYISLSKKIESLLLNELKDKSAEFNAHLISLDEYVIDKFLDDILFLLMDENEISFLTDINYEIYKEFQKTIELNNDINKCRQKLRDNILKSRNINNDTYYSDIESCSFDFNYLPDAIEQMEAAHILSVSDIKLNIKNNPDEKEKYLKMLSNENNGIIIDHIYHDAFDKNWLKLDYNGVFQPTKEWNKRYTLNGKIYKHGLVKIKDNVLNDEMINFISMRK